MGWSGSAAGRPSRILPREAGAIVAPLARLATLVLVLALAGAAAPPVGAAGARPPEQPASGPGGRDYLHGGVQASRHGSGPEAYWLFEPDLPRPERAPLVVFFHGWGHVDPHTYGAWIEHLVRKGAVVVFPRYQESLTTTPSAMMEGAEAALAAAMEELSRPGHVLPDRRRVLFVGHSLGALLAANLAAEAPLSELPRPSALALLHPADLSPWPGLNLPGSLLRATYEAISATTHLLVLVGDADLLAGERFARALWERMGHIPDDRRNAIRLISDDYGSPPLRANHSAPQAPGGSWSASEPEPLLGTILEGTVDALDPYGYWKWVDALMGCAFEGRWCAYVLGDGEPLRAMGRWSDGRRVNEAARLQW